VPLTQVLNKDLQLLKKIFEPRFTTKAKGNGIGLYISQKIAAKVGASLTASNSENGACFMIQIPTKG